MTDKHRQLEHEVIASDSSKRSLKSSRQIQEEKLVSAKSPGKGLFELL